MSELTKDELDATANALTDDEGLRARLRVALGAMYQRGLSASKEREGIRAADFEARIAAANSARENAEKRVVELEGAYDVMKRQHDFQFDKCKRAESALAECIKLSDAMADEADGIVEAWAGYATIKTIKTYRQWRAKR